MNGPVNEAATPSYERLLEAIRRVANDPKVARAVAECDPPKWLRISEAVEIYRLSKSRLYELIHDGTIRSCSLPGSGRARFSRRVLASSLDAYFDRNAQGGNAP